MTTTPTPSQAPRPWLTALVIGLFGLFLIWGGVKLIGLGGSWYYLVTGLAFLATSGLLFLRMRQALWLYAVVVLATVIWAVAEIGLDWWKLVPRGDIVFLIGLWLLTPFVLRTLSKSARGPTTFWRGSALPLTGALIVAGAVGIGAMVSNTTDTLGDLPGPRNGLVSTAPPPAGIDWVSYGGGVGGQRYSTLDQITPKNVDKLTVAWTFRTGDMRGPTDPFETTYEVTPIKVANTLYLCTPHAIVFALDAETGKERWRYDPKVKVDQNAQHLTCRGVSYHEDAAVMAIADGKPAPTALCKARIFVGTGDARLIALDAASGQPCPGFGNGGQVDLRKNMPHDKPGFFANTSPPTITRDAVIVGGAVNDNVSTEEPSGVIRAFDVRTGQLLWNWDAGAPEKTTPLAEGEHYSPNSPNSWGIASVDEALGLVYLPMGNQTPDQYGVGRSAGAEKFASSVVALDIKTGQVRWVYQTVHHDLWDMDLGSQPNLIDINTPTGVRKALIAPTKRGDLYVLDRVTGQPIVPTPEKAVPQGAAPGDFTSPTQPFSQLTFLPKDKVTEADMWGASMFDQLLCRIAFKSLRYEGIFTPPSVKGSLVYPGNLGIFDWGGIAVDPVRQVAFANPDYMGFTSQLVPRDKAGKTEDRAGAPDYANPSYGTPYVAKMGPFLSPLKLPCQAPPWGYVSGVDLAGSKIVWKRKNGTIRDSSPVPLPFKMGVPSLGGPIMTGGGVAFMSATLDYYVRGYDVTTGKELWKARLPAGAQATPMTYQASGGRQFVVVVAGGHGSLGTKLGDSVIAYALPRP